MKIKIVIGRLFVLIKKFFNKGVRFFTIPYYKSLCKTCGEDVYFGHDLYMTWHNLSFGHHVYVGDRCSFILARANLHVGNYVMFGPFVTIRGGDHRMDVVGEYMYSVKEKLPENDPDVWIEDDVWIGCNVTILKGVRIGKGSVIGAGALVTKDVPPYTVQVGVSDVKQFKRFTDSEIILHEKQLTR